MIIASQRTDQSQRENKIKKSLLYKEMLDNQILMNQQYRKEHSADKNIKTIDKSNQQIFIPTVIHSPTEHLENSIVHELDRKYSRSKNRFLPLLKDKNTFYRGSSKFLKVEDTNKFQKDAKHIKTEQIQQEKDQQDEQDEYYSTCERIIKELQNIKSKPIRFRARRKVYDMSDMMHRRDHQLSSNNTSQQQNQTSHQQDLSIPSINHSYLSNKMNPENRYSKYINADISATKSQKNQFNESRYQQYQSTKIKKEAQRQLKYNEKSLKKENPLKIQNQFAIQQGNNVDNGSEMIEDRKKIKSNFEKHNINPKTKEIPSYSPISNQKNPNFREEVERKEKKQKMKNERIQFQRQNFLQLLRKVKNRGESLYIKFSKFPTKAE